MQISIGTPIHGWLPFAISIGGRTLEFRASNVVNDPVTDLLYTAMWALDPEYDFPPVADGQNTPWTTSVTRCAHFWLEPDWHTLTIEATDDRIDQLDLWFAVQHTGGLFVTDHDISQTHQTLTTTLSAIGFANLVYRAVDDLLRNDSLAIEKHWKRPFPRSTFITLGEWLNQISSAENAG